MSQTVTYWHPKKSGWHVGELVCSDGKFATIKPVGNARKLIVPVKDIREERKTA